MKLIANNFLFILILFTLNIKIVNASEYINHKQIPTIDLHFIVLTKNKSAHIMANKEEFIKEVKILNKYFVTKDREEIILFRFKSFSNYNKIHNSECEFIKYGDLKYYSTAEIEKLFLKCKDENVRDQRAINFYIIDSYSSKKEYLDKTSHGKNAKNNPFILLDYQRLNHNIQSPEEHEMGHAFGLIHLCYPNAKMNTNILI